MRAIIVVALLFAPVLACTTIRAQDLLAIDFAGDAFRVDSMTGITTELGPTGLQGHNASAVDGQGRLWVSGRMGTASSLCALDPATGRATVQWSLGTLDVRGLAGDGTSTLFAIVDENGPDLLWRLDTTTGAATRVGATGRTHVQGLAWRQGVLFAWDLLFGLLRIDPVTGLGTAVGGTGNPNIQWLCAHSDGRLLGGRSDLFVIDPATGAAAAFGPIAGATDTRGAEELPPMLWPFGTGCASASGTNTLVGAGTPAVNQLLLFTASSLTPSQPTVFLLGFDNRNSPFGALPLDLDPLFGTQGCRLHVSPDATLFATTSTSAPAFVVTPVFLPPVARGAMFFVQQGVLEPVPGGLSTSNAIFVRVGP